MLSDLQISNFKKNGYIVIPQFLNSKQTKDLQSSLELQRIKKSKNDINVSIDDEKVLDFLCNNNLKKVLNLLIGPKVYFLHDVNLLDGPVTNNNYTWHRDNPCRRTGIGQDWDNKEEYNVVSAAVYLCDSNETQSSLSVIPKSHLISYSSKFSNILRVIHLRTRAFSFLKPLRRLIQSIIAKEIYYKPGDLIIFLCNLYHSGSVTKYKTQKVNRQCIISRFGGSGNHSKTFMNYELNYRHQNEKFLVSKKKEEYFQKLKQNDLYISPDIEKKKIEGIFIPKDSTSDRLIKK